jgi:hypothetical protein
LLAVPAAPGLAQQPISAIDWLDQRQGLPGRTNPVALPDLSQPPVAEPPVASAVVTPEVTTRPLDAPEVGAVGLLPRSVTGLPPTLWQGSSAGTLARQLGALDVAQLPAMQSLLYTLLLAEAEPPADPSGTLPFLLARVDALTTLGAVDPALALIDRAGPAASPDLFARWFDLSLLAGQEDAACTAMQDSPALAPSMAALSFCRARQGDWPLAELTFANAAALGVMPKAEESLLRLYLDPDLAEETPPLPPPARMTPLVFRLSEAIGTPVPATGLPLAYAMADLRGLSGWRAEIEAAERLARTGALAENRLIGIYTDREPAASGGLWDRVEAIQQMDRALSEKDAETVDTILPAAWTAIREAGLELPFARLWASDLTGLPLTGAAAEVAYDLAMLSPDYETHAARLPATTPRRRFLAATARGTPGDVSAPDALSAAIARGFAGETLPPAIRLDLAQDKLGEAILSAMALYISGAGGETKDIVPALATFRATGLEDTARRAALQLLILERQR